MLGMADNKKYLFKDTGCWMAMASVAYNQLYNRVFRFPVRNTAKVDYVSSRHWRRRSTIWWQCFCRFSGEVE